MSAVEKPRSSPIRNLRRELAFDVEQIEDNSRLYRAGRISAYKGVAIQMRAILLKGRRALLERSFPGVLLHQLKPSKIPPEVLAEYERPVSERRPTAVLAARGSISLLGRSPGVLITVEYLPEPALTVEEWIRQWILQPDVRIDRLLNEVANEEVAHTEQKYGETIEKTLGWTFSPGQDGRSMRYAAVVGLGDYVARRVRELLNDPTQEAQR